MTTISLRDFYPWYIEDQFIEVSGEVAAELRANRRYEATHQRRVTRNRARYSLDYDDGIEYSVCLSEPTPQALMERMEWFLSSETLLIPCPKYRAAVWRSMSFLVRATGKSPWREARIKVPSQIFLVRFVI